ncbi:hypothetical protein [Umezawaea tangerina]|uniref:hypothetical protein n=1 Tax=Umezawaea tangerina TaxID=84725 RepID=UPI0011B2415C|nr:hypothetical protein [Umezawaea tangerina]
MSPGVRTARPVELGIATAVLMALGLAAAVAGLLVPDTGPLAATAAVGGLMIAALAAAAWFGSAPVHRTLIGTVVVVAVALLALHAPWSALVLAAAGLLPALPRVRAWYRQPTP